MADAVRFSIRFTGFNKSMVVLGLTRRNSYVDVTDADIVVRMAWSFRASAPRSSIRSVAPDTDKVWGWGAHGWRGEWLVNGSSSGLVRIEFEPHGRAWCIGFPIRLRVLRVAVEDPDALVAALS